ncbi:MAG: glycosyltransferase [Ignavibacteria bacterium]|jgi:sugar transferase (PEP-CTERM/EpsH1 system associated)|nr:glycosyltransferase [Ignavibacteria bacterium]
MKILVVLSRFPYPLTKGDKLRAFNQIKHLAVGNEIYLFCLSKSEVPVANIELMRQYCKEVCVVPLSNISVLCSVLKAYMQGKPLQVGYYFNGRAKKVYDKFVDECKPDRIYCQLLRMYEYVKDSFVDVTLDLQDAFSVSTKRRAGVSAWYLRMILDWEADALRRYEDYVIERCPKCTIISDADRSKLHSEKHDRVAVIPNGVDFSYFAPHPEIEKKYDVVFVGRMSYPPNINAVVYLLKEVMPLVWRERSSCNVLIAGAQPPLAITSLASANVHIESGLDRIWTAYASARIMVAPMQIGAGLQNKLLEAMAMKLPCITSDIANAALGAEVGSAIIVAEHPMDYANAILRLLDNANESDTIGEMGYQYVTENFGWERHTLALADIIGR